MGSKYCPLCGRITTTSGTPGFCAWGCGSLKSEPLLPPHEKWANGYLGMVAIAKENYEKREKPLKLEEIKPGAFQIKLF